MAADNTGWVNIPVEIAKHHTLYGVGGWLVLIAIGTVVAPIRIVASMGPLYSSIDFAAIDPMLRTFIFVEIAGNALIALWSIGNAALLFTKHRHFPRSFALFLGFSAVFIVGDLFATKLITDAIGQPMPWSEVFDAETSREVIRSLLGAAIWIPYSFVSRRVNVTFLNRVRGDDPLLKENVAAVF
jgi:hypothetical protein